MSIVAKLFFNHKVRHETDRPRQLRSGGRAGTRQVSSDRGLRQIAGDLVGGGRPSYMGTPLVVRP